MSKKLIGIAAGALLLVCIGLSVYNTLEAIEEMKREQAAQE